MRYAILRRKYDERDRPVEEEHFSRTENRFSAPKASPESSAATIRAARKSDGNISAPRENPFP